MMQPTVRAASHFWMVESVSYDLCKIFIKYASQSDNTTCSTCMYRIMSAWDSIAEMIPEMLSGNSGENNEEELQSENIIKHWFLICTLICSSFAYEGEDTITRLIEEIENQARIMKIGDAISSTVIQYLHTMLTMHFILKEDIHKAYKHMAEHKILCEEQVKHFLEGYTSKSVIPDELGFFKLQKHLVVYIEAVMEHIGKPKLHEVISNIYSDEDSMNRRRMIEAAVSKACNIDGNTCIVNSTNTYNCTDACFVNSTNTYSCTNACVINSTNTYVCTNDTKN